MRVVIAPDKFKGTFDAVAVADAMARGVRRALPSSEIDVCPMADGGEGTAAALLAARGGRWVRCRVTGPLPDRQVDARFALLDDGSAALDMASASGLALIEPGDRDPMNTTTFGTGELIAAAARAGARRILVGCGGSGTIDLGIGAAQACRFTVLLRNGGQPPMTEPVCGRDVADLLTVKHGRGEVTNGIEIVAAVDVDNPLLGDGGAIAVFGRQKGLAPDAAIELEQAMATFVGRNGWTAAAARPGAGAAGGLAFGLSVFFRAEVRPGGTLIADANRLPDRLRGADVCLTGEGAFDAQTARGKTVTTVSQLCAASNVPCIAIVGRADAAKPSGLHDLRVAGTGDAATLLDIERTAADAVVHF